jgi:hypothetical protein
MRIERGLAIVGYDNDGDMAIFNEQGACTNARDGVMTTCGQVRCLVRASCGHSDTAKRPKEWKQYEKKKQYRTRQAEYAYHDQAKPLGPAHVRKWFLR